MTQASEAERTLLGQIRWLKLPEPVTEYRFDTIGKRRWRFDMAWPNFGLAVEVEGGAFTGGRHTRGQAFADDCVKYNTATLQGWRVLRVTPRQITDYEALDWIKQGLTEQPIGWLGGIQAILDEAQA